MVPKFRQSVSVVILFLLTIALIVSYSTFSAEIPAIAQSSDAQVPNEPLDTIQVTITPPTHVIRGRTVTFRANTSVLPSGYDFIWSFGDGQTRTEDNDPTITHVYNTLGARTVNVIVTNGINSGAASVNVNVIPEPPTETPQTVELSEVTISTNLDKIGEDLYRVGPNINFRMIAQVSENTRPIYEWRIIGDPTFEPPGNNPVAHHQFRREGIYEVEVTVHNELGKAVKDKITIQVLPESVAGLEFRTNKVINSNEALRLGASVKTGTNVQYSFDYGDSSKTYYPETGSDYSLPTNAPIHYSQLHEYVWKPNSTNEYLVTIKADNEVPNNSAEIQQCIVVRPPLVEDLRIVSEKFALTTSEAIDFEVKSSLNNLNNSDIEQSYTYSWKAANVHDSNSPTNFLPENDTGFRSSFPSNGVYLIQVTVTSPSYKETSCADTTTVQDTHVAYTILIVGETPPDRTAVISVNNKLLTTNSNQTEVEMDRNVLFTINQPRQDTDDPSGVVNFTWDFGDGSPPNGSTGTEVVEHQYDTPGVYILEVKWAIGNEVRAFYGIIHVTGQKTFVPLSFLGLPIISRFGAADPIVIPTNTPVRPTNTPILPTSTPIPPTATPIPPTATDAPTATDVPTDVPTDTPTMIPTNTAEATVTLSPTPVPPTATPEPPTPVATDTPTATLTNTPTPTSTSIPENTAIPTITPIPTSSLLKPTPIPTSTRTP